MVLMAVLCLVLIAGLIAIVRWRHLEVVTPWDPTEDPWPLPAREVLRRYLWWVTLAVVSGIVAGLIMVGVGGRLAMRLLAVTAGDAAQGQITEADQIVGEITFGGSLGFIGFFGFSTGFTFGVVYMLVRWWLPKAAAGGAVFGALLLVLAGSRIEPLRPDNLDFGLVGPGWLSVLIFVAMGIAFGMLLAALAGRYSRALPLISKQPRTIAPYVPLVLIIPVIATVVPLALGALFALLLARTRGLRELVVTDRTMMVGRAIGVIAALIAAPHFVGAIVDIIGRS